MNPVIYGASCLRLFRWRMGLFYPVQLQCVSCISLQKYGKNNGIAMISVNDLFQYSRFDY